MEEITVQELKQKKDNNEELNIIDVREDYEYEEYNIGATLIPLDDMVDRMEELEPFKEKELIIHCRSGVRSMQAKLYLEDNGFKNVLNLKGGMLAWQQAFDS